VTTLDNWLNSGRKKVGVKTIKAPKIDTEGFEGRYWSAPQLIEFSKATHFGPVWLRERPCEQHSIETCIFSG
jgi:hypothetical protein